MSDTNGSAPAPPTFSLSSLALLKVCLGVALRTIDVNASDFDMTLAAMAQAKRELDTALAHASRPPVLTPEEPPMAPRS